MTPEQTLTAAAEHVLGPYRPIDDGYLAEAIADWLKAASLDPDIDREHDGCDRTICQPAAALAVARQILGEDQT